jgi:hypothetical protein
MNEFKIDKKAFSIASITDESDEKLFWLSKSPAERLETAEYLRQIVYGYDPDKDRIKKFFEVVELSSL